MYITRLELQKSQEFSRSLDLNEIENLLYCAEADLTSALTIAGLKGLKEIGKNPVITTSTGTAEEINQYRVKELIRGELNVYLAGHYLSNDFSNGRYAINVVLHNESAIASAENISLESLSMRLKRNTLPFIGPQETLNHSAYWVASVPLTIDIQELHGTVWTTVATRTIVISSILTSRYPLLESLMNEYNHTINGTSSPLWIFTTVFSNLYSLIRGFKHYREGIPLNIMDNRHLAVIINSGLILEHSLIFGSVDPLSLVELAQNTKRVLKQTPQDALTTFNDEMSGDGYVVDTDNISEGSANVDVGDPINESINIDPSINLSEIAERILYNISSITLHFMNDIGESQDELIVFDGDIQAKINEVIQRCANQSFFLTSITKHLSINTTTLDALESIISHMYQDVMVTQVRDRRVGTEIWGDPGGVWVDGGAGVWEAISWIPLSKQQIKPKKGQVSPGCALYQARYNVSYERIHYWWRIEQHNINGSLIPVKVWHNVTDSVVETVTLQIILKHYAKYQDTQDDIVDVLYYNDTIDDQNLEDTLAVYQGLYPDTHPEKQHLILTMHNIGMTGLNATVNASYSEWVLEEAWSCLEEIFGSLCAITLDPGINVTHYPNPLILIEMAKRNLLEQFNEHCSEYLDFPTYHPSDEFCSVGKKAIYYSRKWYVEVTKNMTETIFSAISGQLTSAVDAAIEPYTAVHSANVTELLNDASDALRNQFTIPFGNNMTLTRYNAQGISLWNESVCLAVDHGPNYLDPFKKTSWGTEELWTLKIRNRCLFGPSGLPLLPPTPVSPWVLTMNLWLLDIQGEYAQFKILDTSDETIFNPLLGHEPQTYVRELKVITQSNITLGENTRLSFGFTTLAFGIVPPWGMMIGDIQENWLDDHTFGFDEE